MGRYDSVPCPVCDKTIGSAAALASHMRAMHPEEHAARQRGEAPPETPASHGLVWEEPPPRGRRNQAIDAIVALIPELRRNPGRWARLYTWATASGANSTQTKLRKDPTLTDIEFVARSTKSDRRATSALYGRYTGE